MTLIGFHFPRPTVFLRLTATLAIVLGSAGAASAAKGLEAAVVVVGGTPAGIAAAVTAARLGSEVLLLEPSSHVGGIVSNGLTNADITNRKAIAGFFDDFSHRVLEHYQVTYGPDSPQARDCRGGQLFEPRVAESIFVQMIGQYERKLHLVYRHRLHRAVMQGRRVVSLVVQDLNHDGEEVPVRGRLFVDATYEGDLLAMAGAAYRVGREGRQEFGELHAGRIYAYFGTSDPLSGSTGEPDRGIQAYCFRIFATADPANRVAIEKPPAYNPDDYRLLAEDIRAGRVQKVRDAIQLWPMPNGKVEVNSDHVTSPQHGPAESLDLAEEVWGYPEGDQAQRQRIFQRCWNYDVGLLWFLAHDPRVPKAIQDEMQRYGFCKDEFTDNGCRPRQMYVRETRRLVGRYVLTEDDGRLTELERTRVQPTSIAIAEFPWDCHAVHKYNPAHPGVREGYFYIRHSPVQVPYGVLVPRQVDGLLVPVCCSASHVGFQALRVEPTWMALGQAAGAAAHLAARGNVEPNCVSADDLQIALVRQKAVITHYEDLPTDHPAFAALQFLGARGLNPGYRATPELRLTCGMGAERLRRILAHMSIRWAGPAQGLDEPLRAATLAAWLAPLGWPSPQAIARGLADRQLTLADFAQLIFESYQATRSKNF